MASSSGGKETPDAESTTGKSNMTCAVCLEVYRDPKFLPCHHTFCARCIRGVAERSHGNVFPCPQCRKATPLPPEGVPALQSNFYFSAEDLERARNGKTCPTHSQKELEFFCVRCDLAICINCKLTKHEQHETEDMQVVAERKRKELVLDWPRLQKTLVEVRLRTEGVKSDLKFLQEQKDTVETAVLARHAAVLAAADKLRDDELASLRALAAPLERGMDADLDRLRNNLNEVGNLDQRLEQAISSSAGCDMISLATELKDGRWSHLAEETLTSVPRRNVGRVDLKVNVSSHMVTRRLKDFIGTVSHDSADNSGSQLTAVYKFRCGEDTDIEVYSVCPAGNDKVLVSYAQRGRRHDAPGEKFEENGTRLVVAKDAIGKVSWISKGNGQAIYPIPEAGRVKTYNKSFKQWHYRLENDLTGKAEMKVMKVVSKDPWKTKPMDEFKVRVGAHLAHDVDDTQQLIAVLEEDSQPPHDVASKDFPVTYRTSPTGQPSERNTPASTQREGSQTPTRKASATMRSKTPRGKSSPSSSETLAVLTEPQQQQLLSPREDGLQQLSNRRVLLYNRNKEEPVATYTPPSPAFRPTDVCFYWLGAQQVLIVSDDANDCLHVISVEDGDLVFLSYLLPDCPLLIQPTALNVDQAGRLWVACRGGDVLTVQPLTGQ
ncbi:E3 ubiquitin-protein ligase TRIM7-like [Littorina saxatilis]|uniref:E3 ubiquitin-protein ligase TRIM7-like n=1 Tax=Littorina saxatilis TaxID=31220 RepID=UPI0038B65204